MIRRIGYKPLVALALAGVMAVSTAPASAQPRGHDRGHDRGWHGGPPPPRHHDRGHRGRDYGRPDNSGAVIGGALLGLGILGGALALQQSQVAPPPAYYDPGPGYYGPPPVYAPPPGYYGYK